MGHPKPVPEGCFGRPALLCLPFGRDQFLPEAGRPVEVEDKPALPPHDATGLIIVQNSMVGANTEIDKRGHGINPAERVPDAVGKIDTVHGLAAGAPIAPDLDCVICIPDGMMHLVDDPRHEMGDLRVERVMGP